MLTSHEWLLAFVPHERTPEEVRDLVSAHVATVDAMERLRTDLRDVVVARVVEAARHPNADTLWITKVDDGSGELLDVVCGAPVVTVGTLYPFARTGITLPGGVKLEKRKIRGLVSNGMLCSAKELALGEDAGGIMALTVHAAPGTPLMSAMPIGDVRFEIDVLPNRPDLLSHLGVARELAGLTGLTLRTPQELADADSLAVPQPLCGAREASSGGVTIRLEDPEGCPRYMGVVIRGVTVAPSPDWLAHRLESVGLRPINNVVDVTNYFLMGYGQPMHAFDLATLARSTIVVRRARAGEKLVTLDGVERMLDDRMTVIADAERAVAVAGVIGGRDSEVRPPTADLLLEVAYFTPPNVRITRRALGLNTDASYRFERGIDPALAPLALAHAAALIVRLAGGRVDGTPMDVGQAPSYGGDVTVRPGRVAALLGDQVTGDDIARLLRSVGFAVSGGKDGSLRVIAPSWRNDVSREPDLVEEVARLRGYDVLPDDLRPFRPGTVPDHPLHLTARRLRTTLAGDGLVEVWPMPFVRGADDTHVRVRNPLAEDEPHLRRSLLETLARRAEYNLSRMLGDLRIFEIGSTFAPRADALPREEMRVAAILMGQRRPAHFTEPLPVAFDAWDAKALGERIAQVAFPGEAVALEPGDDGALWTITAGANCRPVGRVAAVTLDRPPWAAQPFGVEVTLGLLPNDVVARRGAHDYRHNAYHAAAATSVALSGSVGSTALLTGAITTDVAHAPYRPLPNTPAAVIDLALVMPETLPVADVERVLRTSGGELLERVDLFDEYRGEHVPGGFRSVAWRLTFRDPVRTLREKEIEGRRLRILRALESELGVRPRTG